MMVCGYNPRLGRGLQKGQRVILPSLHRNDRPQDLVSTNENNIPEVTPLHKEQTANPVFALALPAWLADLNSPSSAH